MTTYDSKQAIADIPAATYDDLKARFAELAGVVDAVSAERHALWVEIQRREKAVKIGLRMGAMDDADKALAVELMGSKAFQTEIGVSVVRKALIKLARRREKLRKSGSRPGQARLRRPSAERCLLRHI